MINIKSVYQSDWDIVNINIMGNLILLLEFFGGVSNSHIFKNFISTWKHHNIVCHACLCEEPRKQVYFFTFQGWGNIDREVKWLVFCHTARKKTRWDWYADLIGFRTQGLSHFRATACCHPSLPDSKNHHFHALAFWSLSLDTVRSATGNSYRVWAEVTLTLIIWKKR